MGFRDSTEKCSPISIQILSPKILRAAVVLLSVTSCVAAYDVRRSESVYNSEVFKRLESAGTILVDRRAQPLPQGVVLHQRQVGDNSESSTSTAAPSTVSIPTSAARGSTATTITDSASPRTSSTASATTSSAAVDFTGLPSPFDTSLGSNFTQSSCPAFFNSFLANDTFKSCLPVSVLLRNSKGFFQVSQSATLLGETLDAACSASLAICSPLMAHLATNLIDDANCGPDYRNENAIVMQAYAGLLAYEPLYNTTCLQNPLTGNYCFSEAMVNSTNPSDPYPYYTALGIPLPESAQPSCSSCLQRTMTQFAGYAKLKNQPIAQTYLACASQVDSTCGATFADTHVQVASVSSNDATLGLRMSPLANLIVAALSVWQVLT